jgi:hypothetical protein
MPIPMWEDDSEPSFGTHAGKGSGGVLQEATQISGRFHTHCLKTDETTELEPGKLEFRWYAPGVGLIRDDTLELVSSGF